MRKYENKVTDGKAPSFNGDFMKGNEKNTLFNKLQLQTGNMHIKKLLYLAVLVASLQASAQQKYNVKGQIKNIKDQVTRVYLMYRSGDQGIMDSVDVKDGAYSFSGTIQEPTLARVRAAYPDSANGKKRAIVNKRDFAVVFLEPSNITVINTDSFGNATVKGSKAHDAYLELNGKLKDVDGRQEKLSAEYSAFYRAKNEAEMKRLEPKFDELSAERKAINKAYLQSNPKSPIAMYTLNQVAGWDINADEVEPLFTALPKSTQDLPSGVELKEKIEIAKKTGIGRFAMDFTQNDTLGNPIALSSFKGKYVLIDFWASWCGPCRAENPNVVKAFNKYRGKGFHIVGVSLDRPNAKDKWIAAIHDDQLTWTHVSDLQFWKNAVAVQYGIQAIPQNFLLDPQGKIVAKNIRGEELDKKLSEFLDKP